MKNIFLLTCLVLSSSLYARMTLQERFIYITIANELKAAHSKKTSQDRKYHPTRAMINPEDNAMIDNPNAYINPMSDGSFGNPSNGNNEYTNNINPMGDHWYFSNHTTTSIQGSTGVRPCSNGWSSLKPSHAFGHQRRSL